ncbi:uncharacterized protein K452DRAFT_307013 [Aplosporella prunicola CBS 121167]|uniref:Lon protease homolog 2, peroxisomal n=1 Tax=Aplosporella prunicola CBS 121167 TaxID=1176127 RepID=A0A6A6BL85_9PEZI|nr:uncharacterized protein K452DRAFT_307013 [Aplosporella prunicola CBS 121167]KAF2143617.1 hypothetical protein K452DRAFT_307013 [Aplosporella prunicola CBS 121167]
MATPKSKVLPIIPLAVPSVLLPGYTLRVSLADRVDIASLLAHIYSLSPKPKPDAPVTIGCVPLNSPLLSREGERLINHDASKERQKGTAKDPVLVEKDDLFGYGVLGKVSAVQGRLQGELHLVVDGVSRFKVHKIIQERPYFEAELEHLVDDFNPADPAIQQAFEGFKQVSREFLALVRMSAIMPRSTGMPLSPSMARRLELYISKKGVEDAGTVADFMTDMLQCSHEDRLRVLAAVDVKNRLECVVEILQAQIQKIQGNNRIMTISSGKPGIMPDMDRLGNLQRRYATNMRMPAGMNGFPPFPGFGGGAGAGGQEGDNELEELKKRLDEAKLSPEAQKVSQRELQRLQKMNPAQAEYQVCRNYLENLAEIPWSKVTEDHLDAQTLSRARKQLDDDHHGLEKVKKRLLEYLAVLKLKQSVNADIDAQIKQLTDASSKEEAGAEAQNAEGASKQLILAKDAARREPNTAKNSATHEPSEEEQRLMERKRMVDKSPILLLVGPPGVGKTSLAKSVATALGRKFHRISLGGVRDEAEIRGHRRTYVAAMPGLVVNGLKKVGVANPVFLLDEIDKVGMANHNGDPSAAMLEVLDPEQNHTFTDHYINIPIDLSKVLFIATANSLETIPPPLLDRMETIQLTGYTTLEKRHIATQHLVPKQIMTNGLGSDKVSMSEDVLDKIITCYTRESGVRNLEREIGSVCRYKAVEYAEATDANTPQTYQPEVRLEDLENILGVETFTEELAERHSRPGVVTGLVAYSTGGQGSILFIEVADMPGTGRVQLTGKLGDVLKESVEVALTWVKAHAFELGLTGDPREDIMKARSIHVHCPSGAIPKDGPSAGLAHTIALISLFAGKPVPPRLAMTGEVSLRGRVLPVGGIKEKLIGALRAGVEMVLLPEANRKDAKDLPDEVKSGLRIVHVGHIWEAMRLVWPDATWPGERPGSGVESRL